MGLTSVVGRIFWGFFADRHGARLTLMMTLFMQGAFILWLVGTQRTSGVLSLRNRVGIWLRRRGDAVRGGGSRAVRLASLWTGLFRAKLFAMVGMAVGGFLGGYLYDVSHTT